MTQETSDQRWQLHLDRQFPHGVLASWEGQPGVLYPIPRIVVDYMAGFDPVVKFPVFSGSDKVLGPWQLTSSTKVPDKSGVWKLTFLGLDRALLVTGNLPPRLRLAMQAERDKFFSGEIT